MVNLTDVHGKCLAMMAWGKKADGSNEVVVFTGTTDWDGRRLLMRRGHGKPPLEIQDEWLDRIEAAHPSLQSELLGAEYYFSVTIGPLSAADDASQLQDTGLIWPINEGAS